MPLSVTSKFVLRLIPIALSRQCVFVSLLTDLWLIHLFSPRPVDTNHIEASSNNMCSITPESVKVSSSYNHMWDASICFCQDHYNCSHWGIETAAGQPWRLRWWVWSYHYILLYLLVFKSQYSRFCCHICSNNCIKTSRQSSLRFVLSKLLSPLHLLLLPPDIPLFMLTRPAKQNPNQGWEFIHRLHLYPMGGVFTPSSIKYELRRRRYLIEYCIH